MMSRVSITILYQMNIVRGGSLGLRGRSLAELSGIGLVKDSSTFRSSSYLKNRAPARDILEISSIHPHRNRSKLRSRAEHSENFDRL